VLVLVLVLRVLVLVPLLVLVRRATPRRLRRATRSAS